MTNIMSYMQWRGFQPQSTDAGGTNGGRTAPSVRVRLDAECLLQRGLTAVYDETLAFLAALGYTDIDDVVSRADMNVNCTIPLSEFHALEDNDHVVTRLKNGGGWQFIGTGKKKKYTSLTLGVHGERVQCQIYDKRIEFRLGRKALNMCGIRSIADLLKRDRAVVNKLMHDWFRILASPKVRGTENKAAVQGIEKIICPLFQKAGHISLQKINDIVSRIETLSGIPIRATDKRDYGMSNPADAVGAWERFCSPPAFHLRR